MHSGVFSVNSRKLTFTDLLTEFSCGSTDESNRSISFFYLWLCREGRGEEGKDS